MIASCPRCGIENRDKERVECRFCGYGPLMEKQGEEDGAADGKRKLCADLAAMPMGPVLRSWRDLNRATLVFFPVIILIVLVKKAFKRPFPTPVLNDATPRFREASLEELQRLSKKSIGRATEFLEKLGFELRLDLVCLQYSQTLYAKIFQNKDCTRHAIVYIGSATGRVQQMAFEALTSGKKCLLVMNRQMLPIKLANNILVRSKDNLPPDKLADEFESLVRETGERLVPLSIERYLPLRFKIDSFIIAQGIKQGVFMDPKKDAGSASSNASFCVNHPLRPAVRKCAGCGAALCESCYTAKGDFNYCQHCLNADAETEAPPALPGSDTPPPVHSVATPAPSLEPGYAFAGLGARGLAKIIDLLCIAIFVFAAGYGFHLLFGFVAGKYSEALSAIAVQATVVLTVVFYFTWLFRRLGGCLGHKALGMRVVDKRGETPSMVSAAVRFTYHILSMLFVFPVVGYLFIAFRKQKRGLHDTLANTWVVARHTGIKAVVGWIVIAALASTGGLASYQSWKTFFSPPSVTIGLEKKWEIQQESSFVLRTSILSKNLAITAESAGLSARDMRTGKTVWSLEGIEGFALQTPPGVEDFPLIGSFEDESGTVCMRVEKEDGKVMWQAETGLRDARILVDKQGVLAWSQSAMKWFDADGRMVWEMETAISPGAEVHINGDVFIARYGEFENNSGGGEEREEYRVLEMTCIALSDGTTRWREENPGQYANARPLMNGFEIVENPDGRSMMVYLPERRVVWTIEDHPGPVFYFKPDRESSPSEPPLLYTNTKILRGADGSVVFEYPENRNPPVVTEDWLILSDQGENKAAEALDTNDRIVVMDRFSGEVIAAFRQDPFEGLILVSEDDSFVYLVTYQAPKFGLAEKTPSRLFMIDKQGPSLRKVGLGDNIPAWNIQVKAFPDSGTLFISKPDGMGGYAMPDSR